MNNDTLLIFSLLALVSLSAFFSASETAYTSLNRARLKSMANGGNRRAERALALSEDYDRLLSGILVGNNIVNILSASLATVLFVRLIGGAGVSLSTAVMTIVVLMFGEIAPKSIAKERPEQLALALCPALYAILKLLTPIIFLTTCWQKLVYRVFKPADERGITEEELITIVEEAESDGEIDAHESELIRSAIEFGDLTAEDILTPRVNVIGVDVEDSDADVARAFEESGRSRIPVYEGSLDTIVGILHEKDFYQHRDQASVREMMTAPLCVLPTTRLDALLKLLQKTKNHMAVVVDEYGGVSGIVTMEDILEELVGEIWDEHDEVVEDIVQLSDGRWQIDGGASLDDVRERFPIAGEFDSVTVNGWVLEVLGHLPEPGESFEHDGLRVTVENVDNRRVERVIVEKTEIAEE